MNSYSHLSDSKACAHMKLAILVTTGSDKANMEEFDAENLFVLQVLHLRRLPMLGGSVNTRN